MPASGKDSSTRKGGSKESSKKEGSKENALVAAASGSSRSKTGAPMHFYPDAAEAQPGPDVDHRSQRTDRSQNADEPVVAARPPRPTNTGVLAVLNVFVKAPYVFLVSDMKLIDEIKFFLLTTTQKPSLR